MVFAQGLPEVGSMLVLGSQFGIFSQIVPHNWFAAGSVNLSQSLNMVGRQLVVGRHGNDGERGSCTWTEN